MEDFSKSSTHGLMAILQKAENGSGLTPVELHTLLKIQKTGELEDMFAVARRLRAHHFGSKVFLYGFLYISTHCRNLCTFCLYRRGNPAAPRYRKSRDEIVALALKLAGTGVHLIDLTMGEDPALYDDGGKGFSELHETLDEVMAATDLPVMLSAGVVPPASIEHAARQGVTWYACYQETHSFSLFARLRRGQNYELRLQSKRKAHDSGLLIEEGVLTGIGETCSDLADSLAVMRSLDADQVRVMGFVPQTGTPMASMARQDNMLELKMIALMRICMPDRLIPASLDIDGLAGLRQRLNAGANVVTSLVPSGAGLKGVAQSRMDIEAGGRSVTGIQNVIESCGLSASTKETYRHWIDQRRHGIIRRTFEQTPRMRSVA